MDDDTMSTGDKIAIVGIGCRFANGINGVYKFWDTLAKGLDCTIPPPPHRFDASHFLHPGEKLPGKMYNKCAGYLLQDLESFDRQFFKISPEEAKHLDPQVRLLLEVVWETLQDAGVSAHSLRGSNTGVYMGVTASEYGVLVGFPADNINLYTNTGTNTCMASNRISYEYDFHGPSLTVNTACSSSLYSILLGCDGIRKGQCELALAGGVNLSLLQMASIGFCQGNVLSPDGKSKTFDKSADGFARGEGVGTILLKPLQRAMDDGDRIYAVVRGGSVSNDGRTSGIARPSYDAQVALLEKAYEDAKVDPGDVTYLEAHGTGTKVGDMTEANAIGEVMGGHCRTDKRPLYIGSVKTNFGHTEAAAGIGGIIKLALCLQHGQIPKQVHFTSGNENVDFNTLNIRVPTELMKWPEGEKKLVGCSSFGFGGANAHVVLEGWSRKKQSPIPKATRPKPSILFISAASKNALLQYLKDWEIFINDKIRDDRFLFRNALFTAAARSTHHEHRICIIARSPQEAKNQIRLKLDQDAGAANSIIEGQARDEDPSAHRLVFVYSGMGAQWWGMARRLVAEESTFANVIKAIDKILTKCGAKWSLTQVLTAEEDQERINKTDVAQPCLCAVQIGLTEYYRSRGIIPSAIVGHSVGEVAAAHAAGYLTLEDAVRLIYTRGQQLKKTSGLGMMVAVLHPVEEITARLQESKVQGKIDVAAINSPRQIVLSGDGEALSELTENLRKEGIRCISLKVKNAFHSYQQEKIRKSFLAKVSYLNASGKKTDFSGKSTTPLLSSVTVEYLEGEDVNSSGYWWTNIRQPVQFMAAIQKLLQDGYNYFLEIGPHPVLSSSIRDIARGATPSTSHTVITGSLQRPHDTTFLADDEISLLRSISRLHVEGYPIEHEQLFLEGPYSVVSLPIYPWQRVICSGTTKKSKKLFNFPIESHPLLGKRLLASDLCTEGSPVIWHSKYSQRSVPWLRDHKLQGNTIVPAAAHIETMLAATQEVKPGIDVVTLTDVKFEQFIFAQEGEGKLEVTLKPGPKEASVYVKSFNHTDQAWKATSAAKWDVTTGAQTSIQPLEEVSRCVKLTSAEITEKYPRQMNQSEFYDEMWKHGYHIGETFRSIDTACFNHDCTEAVVFASLPESIVADSDRYTFHPAFLDSIFQGFGVCQMIKGNERAKRDDTSSPFRFQVPYAVSKLCVMGKAPLRMMFHLRITERDGMTYGHAVLADASTKRVFTRIDDMRFEVVNLQSDEHVHMWSKTWDPISITSDTNGIKMPEILTSLDASDGGSIILVKDKLGVSKELARYLDEHRVTVFDPRDSDDLEKDFLLLMEARSDTRDVILLSALDIHDFMDIDTISKDNFSDAQRMTALTTISIYRVVTSLGMATKPHVWVVTSSAHLVTESDKVNPLMAPTSSLSLTFMHEDPELNVTTIDIPATLQPGEAATWLYKYMRHAPSTENHVALRRNHAEAVQQAFEVYTYRVALQPQSRFSCAKMSNRWHIDIPQTVSQKRLVAEQILEKDCGPPEGLVDVKLSAFSVQQMTVEAATFGYLYTGAITSNSAGSGYKAGTTVLGFGKGLKLSSTITAKVSELTPLPDNVKPTDAIDILKNYLPSYVALQETVKTKDKSTVLVCAASDDDHIGLVAAKLAQQVGATVYVHRERESQQGSTIPHSVARSSNGLVPLPDSLDMQSDDFSADVLMFTGDLPHDERTLSKLAGMIRPFGTIVQIGATTSRKAVLTDIPSNVYFVTTGTLFDQRKGTDSAVSSLLHLFDTHEGFKILTRPPSALPISRCLNAHHPMENATVYIDQDNLPALVNIEEATFAADPKASYLVTGGTKGFGLSIVEWLSTCGARHLYVISRNAPEGEASQRFNSLKKIGVSVTHVAADMSSKDQVETALLTVKEDRDHPLEGIFHSATVFRDAYLQNMTQEGWDAVMMSKAFGAVLLHQLSIKLQFTVKYFVMVSSIAEMIGNRGQGSYCAANNLLSALCTMRRSRGLPATSLLPGVISSVGFAAREGLVEQWKKIGLDSLSSEEVLRGLEIMLSSDASAIAVTGPLHPLDFAKGFNVMISHHFSQPGGRFSVLKSLIPASFRSLKSGGDIIERIKQTEPEAAKSLITQTLSTFLCERLGLGGEMSQDASLLSVGVDSHLSTDLSGVIHDQFGVTITPMSLLNDTLTLGNLAESIYRRVLSGEGGQELGSIAPTKDHLDDLWCDINKKLDTPSVQLVCFPALGGGPSMFLPWKSRLADQNIQLITIQLPGWERREHEKPLQNLQDIVTKVADALLPNLVRGRFAFFGHSIGGLIAFEMAHYLRANYNMSPIHLFLSSWNAPTLPFPRPAALEVNGDVCHKVQRIIDSLMTSPDTPITNGLNGHSIYLSFVDPSAMKNVRMRKSLVPSMRAAVNIFKKYRHVRREKLSVNLTVFGGKDDEFIRPSLLDEWKIEVSSRAIFQKVLFSGQHMYIQASSKQVLKNVTGALKYMHSPGMQRRSRPCFRH